MVKNKQPNFTYLRTAFVFIVGLLLPCWAGAQNVDTLQLLYHWNDTSLEGSSQYDNTYNEVWGFVQNGKEYAVIGSTAGTHIISLDEGPNENRTIFVPGSSRGGHVIHRDYHDYKGYLYAVCDEGSSSTIQIIDISQIEDTVNVVYDSADLFSRCHNIFIDTAKAKLYACSQKGGSLSYSPLGVYDISDPVNPFLINTYSGFGNSSIGHVHDAFVYNDTAFLNCGFDGLRVVDFSDPSSPNLLASLTDYPFRGYNHSGWTSEDRSHYYMSDETHGADLKVIDISDMREPEVTSTFNAESISDYSIPHNQLVHCGYLYVPYYFDGLQVYDISNPATPLRSHVYQASREPHIRNYKGAWGAYPFLPSGKILVSDMQEGLFVLQGPVCDIETKVKTAPSLSFKLYPNPSAGPFTVEMPTYAESAKIEIVSMNGSVVYSTETTKTQLQISTPLAVGVYLLKVSANNQYGQQKLIISP